MKNLKQYIEEKLFHQQVDEKLIVNKNYKTYKYHPTTWGELREIIEKRFEELGLGTEQKPINFNDIDVSEITTFYDESTNQGIFEETDFEYIDVSDWNVSKVTDMTLSFYECKNLKSVGDLSNWDVSNVEDMSSMFWGCKSLNKLDLSNWDVDNVKSMQTMFGCCKLEIIPDWYINRK